MKQINRTYLKVETLNSRYIADLMHPAYTKDWVTLA